ncbi:hypothetical protein QOM21_37175 [Streptomyces sp. Pv4-95]|uniref:hypothetical protein n=1 Tax=Streptomyces sp. Pv4-95 TaxID=3049543 RepID=UPI00389261C2
MDASVLTVAVIAAALVIKTALNEIRRPGSARQEWAFVTDGVAMLSGVVAALCLGAMGWNYSGHGTVAWAGLAGLLVAYLTGRRRPNCRVDPTNLVPSFSNRKAGSRVSLDPAFLLSWVGHPSDLEVLMIDGALDRRRAGAAAAHSVCLPHPARREEVGTHVALHRVMAWGAPPSQSLPRW